MIYWILTLSCYTGFLGADHLLTVTQIGAMNEQELQDLSGTTLRLRGFLYKSDDGRLIASSEPDLKSCCVGTEGKIRNQVVLHGGISPQNVPFPVTVQGVFHFDPVFQNGKLTAYAALMNAELVPEEEGFPWPLLLVAVFLFLTWVVVRRKI